MSSIKSCSFFPLPFADGADSAFPFMIRLLLLLSSLVSSSSSDASELRSEFDGDGDCGERFSCSCIIVRNSWMDSLSAHSWESSDKSSWRRPYCGRDNKIKHQLEFYANSCCKMFELVTKQNYLKSNSFSNIANSISFAKTKRLSLLLRHTRVIPSISKFIFETIWTKLNSCHIF